MKRLQLYRERFKNRIMPRRRPEFALGEAVTEAAKLKKFSDAGETQIQWLPDAGRNDFRITSGIKYGCIGRLYNSKTIGPRCIWSRFFS